jgi:hypothetical protein
MEEQAQALAQAVSVFVLDDNASRAPARMASAPPSRPAQAGPLREPRLLAPSQIVQAALAAGEWQEF